MLYKIKKVYDGFYGAHENLRRILHWIESYYWEHFHVEPLMTSSSRTREESIGFYAFKVINPRTKKLYLPEEVRISVHETIPLRGSDLRSSILTEKKNRQLEKAINDEWIYDPKRLELKCCRLHKVGDNAFHLHIQVHNNTIRRNGGSA